MNDAEYEKACYEDKAKLNKILFRENLAYVAEIAKLKKQLKKERK